MGIGDEIMAAGEAERRARAEKGRTGRYVMTDKRGAPKWHSIWEGNPYIARAGETADGEIGYVAGHRPYIVDETAERRTFRPYRPAPATIVLDAEAKAIAREAAGAVVFNPCIKARAPVNKDWGVDRWIAMIRDARDVPWLQLAEPGAPRIPGVRVLQTRSFLQACGALSGAAAAVVHEGALHHAAAAFGIPALVIRGGYISPAVTGYDGQVDMYEAPAAWPQYAKLGCGMRVRCPHCAAAMRDITPWRVAAAVRSVLAVIA